MKSKHLSKRNKKRALAAVGLVVVTAWFTHLLTRSSIAAFRSGLATPCKEHLSAVLHTSLDRFRSPGDDRSYLNLEIWDAKSFTRVLTEPLEHGHCSWGDEDRDLRASEAAYTNDCKSAKKVIALEMDHNRRFQAVFNCFRQWEKFRYGISRQALAESRPGRLSDVAALEAWLYPALFETGGADSKSVAEAAERLAEIRTGAEFKPLRDAALRLGLQARYIEWRQSPQSSATSRDQLEKLKSEIRRLEKDLHFDLMLTEIKLAVARWGGDAKGLHDEALEVRKNYPHFTTGDYYLAVAALEVGDNKERALWHLGRVLILAPDDPRANLAMKQLQDSKGKTKGPDLFPDVLAQFQGLSFRLPPPVDTEEERALATVPRAN